MAGNQDYNLVRNKGLKPSGGFTLKTPVLLLFLLIHLGACHRNSPSIQESFPARRGPISELISTRSENPGPVKILIRLPADPLALIESAQKGEQLELILSQQKKLTQDLLHISDKIQIIYTYKNILNALYVVIPREFATQVDQVLPQGARAELSTNLRRPETQSAEAPPATKDLELHNSVRFIGATTLHQQGIQGQGQRIGVIDTGIDYTHGMLGGSGDPEVYKKVNPDQPTDFFPNSKVVGGYDFVGTAYDSASPDPLLRIPKPDLNPLDESGHGSHVAGTIAGHGDGIKSYSGVAPEATLFALKVFGKDGSTDDAVVMAALDFAANPDQNVETDDALDVVNLSLGSPYGTPKLLYREAIANLNAIGTTIVASAGNSGNISYITGAPGVSDEAFSVAASIDDMDHNWHFGAALFQLSPEEEVIAEMAEASFTKPLKSIEKLNGKLVYVGKGAELSLEQIALLKGNIALIDRGEITFSTKITNVFKAGALGAVVINNTDGSPFIMGGGSETLDIPAVMIAQNPGKLIREKVVQGATVVVDLKSSKTIAKQELIDTLTDFSSRGPRSEDSLIKPEISAPGANIISAKVGGGQEVVTMSGTSMAAPHMAGVMALLKQSHPTLIPSELKSLAMTTAKFIKDTDGQVYPIAQQGAGRIQVAQANEATLVFSPSALSLGRLEIQGTKQFHRTINIKNRSDKAVSALITPKLSSNLELLNPKSVDLLPQEEKAVTLHFKLKPSLSKKTAEEDSSQTTTPFESELDGFISFVDQDKKEYTLPVLLVALQISDVSAGSLQVLSESAVGSVGASVQLDLENHSIHTGSAWIFHLLGQDERKQDHKFQAHGLSTGCDLESVGFRTITLSHKGQTQPILQMALKLYNPLTTWNTCEFSIQIDNNGDGIPEQELAGVSRENTEGLGSGLASLLLDASKARELRKEFENQHASVHSTEHATTITTIPLSLTPTTRSPFDSASEKPLNFSPAVMESMDLIVFNQSTLMVVQAPLSLLKTIPGQNLRVKVGALNLELDTVETDDFLGAGWMSLPVNPEAQTLTDLPPQIEVTGQGKTSIQLTKGEGSIPIIAYYPLNHGALTSVGDIQSQILNITYLSNKAAK